VYASVFAPSNSVFEPPDPRSKAITDRGAAFWTACAKISHIDARRLCGTSTVVWLMGQKLKVSVSIFSPDYTQEPTPSQRANTSEKCQVQTLPRRYSITSSAVARNVIGGSKPNALAVLRLIASSNLVGCSIGRSVGLAPLA
jgi:hypothetical protein